MRVEVVEDNVPKQQCFWSVALALSSDSFPSVFSSVHSSSHHTFVSNSDHTAVRKKKSKITFYITKFFRRKNNPNFASKGFYWLIDYCKMGFGLGRSAFSQLPAPFWEVPSAAGVGYGRGAGAHRAGLRRRRSGPGPGLRCGVRAGAAGLRGGRRLLRARCGSALPPVPPGRGGDGRRVRRRQQRHRRGGSGPAPAAAAIALFQRVAFLPPAHGPVGMSRHRSLLQRAGCHRPSSQSPKSLISVRKCFPCS